ncbi:MAG TPA: glycosyltransferase family A protein [Thermoplasmata archaeon]|nr:glycosyltransferase family A protein [Thermoplasmata archaeon]
MPSSTTSSGPPLPATVIVTAHDRRAYLREAIDSVLAQDIDRSRFELVVVKNFDDPEVDARLDGAGARRLRCAEAPVSRKVLEGLRVSRGRVVFLLDDDDRFEPDKLRVVLEEFAADPRLGFVHHQVRYIGPDNRPLPGSGGRFLGRRPGRARRILLAERDKSLGLARLAYSYPDFNCSSLAIRRDIALGAAPYLARVDGGVDTFFFFAALIAPCSLLLDERPLARYRLHEDNASLASGPDPDARRRRLLEAALRQDRVNRVTLEMVARSGRSALLREIEARSLIDRLSILFRDRSGGRVEALRSLLNGIELRDTFAVRENVPSMAGAALFVLTPRLARSAYERQSAVR